MSLKRVVFDVGNSGIPMLNVSFLGYLSGVSMGDGHDVGDLLL